MKREWLLYCVVIIGVVLYGCRNVVPISTTKKQTPCIVLVDTIVVHNPKVINPIRPIHFIDFLTSDSSLADHKYTEWELLHMSNVYIEPHVITGVFEFLLDTLGIPPRSIDSCFHNSNHADVHGLIFNVRADYYEKHFRATPEFVSIPCPHYSRGVIYRHGYKYSYYKVLVAIPKDFYTNTLRNGSITIPLEQYEK